MPDILTEYPVPGPRTLDGMLGFRLIEVGEDTARAEVPYADRICQRFGLVHGGVYAALAEMVATEATIYHVWAEGNRAAGISNVSNFLRPSTEGTVHANARARFRGNSTWVWDVDLIDDAGRHCAISRVTVAVRPRSSTKVPGDEPGWRRAAENAAIGRPTGP